MTRLPDGPDRGGYVASFAGARDNYQVAIALHEAALLHRLLTDLYLPASVARVLAARGYLRAALPRHAGGLEGARVKSNVASFLAGRRAVRRLLPWLPSDQALLGRALAATTAAAGHGIVAYAGYALEAFRAAAPSQRRVLVQYHPHRKFELEVLARDRLRNPHPWVRRSPAEHCDASDARNLEEIRLADRIVCASSVTRRSLQRLGTQLEKIRVAPYGPMRTFAAADTASAKAASVDCHCLFVGTGSQRKGAHILLAAWARVRPASARLTLVLRDPDPSLRLLARSLAAHGVDLVEGVASAQLERLFLRARIFILPSLVEGFGHVILEALAAGCFVIATDGTGLPDLDLPPEMACCTPAGDMDALAEGLAGAITRVQRGAIDHAGIRDRAFTITWGPFRASIVDACKRPL